MRYVKAKRQWDSFAINNFDINDFKKIEAMQEDRDCSDTVVLWALRSDDTKIREWGAFAAAENQFRDNNIKSNLVRLLNDDDVETVGFAMRALMNADCEDIKFSTSISMNLTQGTDQRKLRILKMLKDELAFVYSPDESIEVGAPFEKALLNCLENENLEIRVATLEFIASIPVSNMAIASAVRGLMSSKNEKVVEKSTWITAHLSSNKPRCTPYYFQ